MTALEIEYQRDRRAHWDSLALKRDGDRSWGRFYHQRITEIFRFLVLPGQRVIEIGCGRGDLLAALRPSVGVGVDFSAEMIRLAEARHPELRFIQADAHELELQETFDVIIMSDLVNDLWDVQTVFQKVAALAGPHTRVIINSYSRLWEIPLSITRRLQLASPTLYQNWLTVEDIHNILELSDFQVVRHWSEILFPLDVPLLEPVLNRFLVKLWPFRIAALTNFVVARPVPTDLPRKEEPLVSVIVPARNEAGHISEILKRTPEMGGGTEIVFVEGHSTDGTYEAIQQAVAENPERKCKIFKQPGAGKGDAVRTGFANADGEILMILDADMTVPPEDLSRFYEAILFGKGEFVNGVRLVYPMEDRAMRFFNLLGNKLFSLVFSGLLGQPIKDTLCGTKVLWKKHYELIAANRAYFGEIDPFGDFDLILGAARLNLKIVDLPIRYRERRYGTTNIQRWKHGIILLKMAYLAAWRLKFI
ncbi:MAG: glycosyltransferase [Desulfomonile tiedjei]|nr:glycosyltransferase [Desulfomonile tiedjei]